MGRKELGLKDIVVIMATAQDPLTGFILHGEPLKTPSTPAAQRSDAVTVST